MPNTPSTPKDRERIVIDQSAVKFIMKCFEDKKFECFSCHGKIGDKNWGGFMGAIGMVCKKLPCLIEFSDRQKEVWNEK